MPRSLRHLLVAAAAAGATTWSQAQAQAPAAPPAPARAATTTTGSTTITTTAAAARLTARDVYDRLEAAGYRDIREIGWDHGRYEVKATNAHGERVKLSVNAATGAVDSSRARGRRD